MRSRLARQLKQCTLAGLAWLLASTVALAQSGPTNPPMNPVMGPGPGHPDLSGYWSGGGGGGGTIFNENPPMSPEGAEIRNRNRAGITNPQDQGLDELDPLTWCYPIGPMRAMVLRQFEIVQTPMKTLILTEWDSLVRYIYTDGRQHPAGWPFGWMGHSIGRWDGETFVVDTVGLNGVPWIDFSGTPYSDELHIVERFRRLAADRLEIQFRFEDPKSYSRPWEVTKTFRPAPEILEHVTCEEHLRMGTYREAHWPPE